MSAAGFRKKLFLQVKVPGLTYELWCNRHPYHSGLRTTSRYDLMAHPSGRKTPQTSNNSSPAPFSRSAGISVHVGHESVITMSRNMHLYSAQATMRFLYAESVARSSSLIEVFARVCASTRLTMTAQYSPYLPSLEGRVPDTTTDPAGTRP
jgi:hypothetical protein